MRGVGWAGPIYALLAVAEGVGEGEGVVVCHGFASGWDGWGIEMSIAGYLVSIGFVNGFRRTSRACENEERGIGKTCEGERSSFFNADIGPRFSRGQGMVALFGCSRGTYELVCEAK